MIQDNKNNIINDELTEEFGIYNKRIECKVRNYVLMCYNDGDDIIKLNIIIELYDKY